MKGIIEIISAAFTICIVTFSPVIGQEKKNEQKIKIVISDDSGERVILDTLIKDSMLTDSIRLKDGKAIFIVHPGNEEAIGSDAGKKYIFVTATSDDKASNNEVKKITIISSDSASAEVSGKCGKTFVRCESAPSLEKGGAHNNVMTWTEHEAGDGKVEKVIIINERNKVGKEGGEAFEYTSGSSDKDTDAERTKYVISRDGMVISVEGDNYARVKDLIKDIEATLDAKNNGTQNISVVNEEKKKEVKKK